MYNKVRYNTTRYNSGGEVLLIIQTIQDICHYLKIDTTKLLVWLLKEDGGAVWSRQPDEGSNWKKRN